MHRCGILSSIRYRFLVSVFNHSSWSEKKTNLPFQSSLSNDEIDFIPCCWSHAADHIFVQSQGLEQNGRGSKTKNLWKTWAMEPFRANTTICFIGFILLATFVGYYAQVIKQCKVFNVFKLHAAVYFRGNIMLIFLYSNEPDDAFFAVQFVFFRFKCEVSMCFDPF